MQVVNTKVNENTSELKIIGRLTVKTVPEVDEAFAKASSESTNVVLDLSELDYIASSGLRSLKRLRSALRKKDGTLTVRGAKNDVMEIFKITGFTAMLAFE